MLGSYIGPGVSTYTEYDRAVVERTKSWLKERQGKGPWCLYVGLVAPHFPLVVPPEFFKMYPLDELPPAKLRPSDGYVRHPWVEKQNALMDSESAFADETERLTAIASYFGLCSWMDHNVGQILKALEASGHASNTTIVYTSDHGDNAGARGLWGKSNCYEESASVPLIMAGAGIAPGVCQTAVSLLDLSASIPAHFGLRPNMDLPGRPLLEIAALDYDPNRVIFSEYHAAGAVSGAYMLRQGRYKLIHYEGFAPELFDLENDPEECTNLAAEPNLKAVLDGLYQCLHAICDPQATDALAHADQAAMIARYGGREKALKLGAPGATPPPKVPS